MRSTLTRAARGKLYIYIYIRGPCFSFIVQVCHTLIVFDTCFHILFYEGQREIGSILPRSGVGSASMDNHSCITLKDYHGSHSINAFMDHGHLLCHIYIILILHYPNYTTYTMILLLIIMIMIMIRHIYLSLYIYSHMYICICMDVCVYIYIYIYIYIHTHTHIQTHKHAIISPYIQPTVRYGQSPY